MRLVCPSCKAAYNVPTTKLGRGAQRLRCARCSHVWSFTPPPPPTPAPDPAPPPLTVSMPAVPTPAAEAFRSKSRGVPPQSRLPTHLARRRPSGPTIGWILSLALLAGLAAAAWQWRQPIMAAWPPSERVYRLFGVT